MEDFTYFDFSLTPRQRIPDNIARVSFKTGNKTITFARNIGAEIARFDTPKMRICRNNLTGEIYLVIGSDKGVDVRYTTNKSSTFICRSCSAVSFLRAHFKITEDTVDFSLSANKANNPDYLTYQIFKK